MKKKIFIFNGTSRAAEYGIGSYIDQLTTILKNSKMEFNLVHLYAQGREVEIVEKEGCRRINIPYPQFQTRNASQYYAMNVAYLLKEFIPDDKDVEYIFHLNFMTNEYLVKSLRKMFNCKIVLVAHYTNWSFSLFGNYLKFKKILTKKPKKSEMFEKSIVKDFKEDIKMIDKVDRFVCIAQHRSIWEKQSLSTMP
ncbi:hypothetical protein FACS1894123_10180 [Bacteroidia bacterium]|nr:hypothetical protein FACS1894123_10180 [Bacteroidia bacterium]